MGSYAVQRHALSREGWTKCLCCTVIFNVLAACAVAPSERNEETATSAERADEKSPRNRSAHRDHCRRCEREPDAGEMVDAAQTTEGERRCRRRVRHRCHGRRRCLGRGGERGRCRRCSARRGRGTRGRRRGNRRRRAVGRKGERRGPQGDAQSPDGSATGCLAEGLYHVPIETTVCQPYLTPSQPTFCPLFECAGSLQVCLGIGRGRPCTGSWRRRPFGALLLRRRAFRSWRRHLASRRRSDPLISRARSAADPTAPYNRRSAGPSLSR